MSLYLIVNLDIKREFYKQLAHIVAMNKIKQNSDCMIVSFYFFIYFSFFLNQTITASCISAKRFTTRASKPESSIVG